MIVARVEKDVKAGLEQRHISLETPVLKAMKHEKSLHQYGYHGSRDRAFHPKEFPNISANAARFLRSRALIRCALLQAERRGPTPSGLRGFFNKEAE